MSTPGEEYVYVSRAGLKLRHALDVFGIDPAGWVCADLGCNAGGFTDCLLKGGAGRVYAVDTGYGALDWKLRNDKRVVVMERTNAMHVTLPEAVKLVVIDVGWTKQEKVLPAARKLLDEKAGENGECEEGEEKRGGVVTLVKPHYEADKSMLRGGVLPEALLPEVMNRVLGEIERLGFEVMGNTPSPLTGTKGNLDGKGNREVLLHLRVKS